MFVTTASLGHREVVGASYFVVGPEAEPYKDIVLGVSDNFGHMFVADYVVDYIHDPIPCFDFLLSHIGNFD